MPTTVVTFIPNPESHQFTYKSTTLYTVPASKFARARSYFDSSAGGSITLNLDGSAILISGHSNDLGYLIAGTTLQFGSSSGSPHYWFLAQVYAA